MVRRISKPNERIAHGEFCSTHFRIEQDRRDHLVPRALQVLRVDRQVEFPAIVLQMTLSIVIAVVFNFLETTELTMRPQVNTVLRRQRAVLPLPFIMSNSEISEIVKTRFHVCSR